QEKRPPLPEPCRNQPAGLRPRRDAGPPLALVERPGRVVPADLARKIDRVQLPLLVPLQGEERERGREAVGDPGLDGDTRPELAQRGVEVDAFDVADRSERVAAPAHLGEVLAAAL